MKENGSILTSFHEIINKLAGLFRRHYRVPQKSGAHYPFRVGQFYSKNARGQ